ncbi:hypothetical protein C8R44DRAFT_10420 [Mycena epipterygia]|nr:hypothetical protein C8R44DRAFT_10420 [Mycena epipterygia]
MSTSDWQHTIFTYAQSALTHLFSVSMLLAATAAVSHNPDHVNHAYYHHSTVSRDHYSPNYRSFLRRLAQGARRRSGGLGISLGRVRVFGALVSSIPSIRHFFHYHHHIHPNGAWNGRIRMRWTRSQHHQRPWFHGCRPRWN